MPVIFYAVLGVIIFCVVALLLSPNLFRPSTEAQRIFDVVKNDKVERHDKRTIGGKERIQDKLLFLASELRIRLGLADNPKLKARVAAAGMHRNASLDIFFAAQFLVPLAGAVAGSLIGSNTLYCIVAFGVIGYLVPDMWLTRKTASRRKRVRRSIPDALDLMVICVDAGLGLDQALLRIGEEHEVSHLDIHDEFVQ